MEPASMDRTQTEVDRQLTNLGRSVQANAIFVASTMPGGELRLTRPAGLGQAFNRLYTGVGQFVDAPSWAAMLGDRAVRGSDHFDAAPQQRQAFQTQWLSRYGYAHVAAAPIDSVVLNGYPGVVVALRGLNSPDFSDADMQALADAARSLSVELRH